MKLLICTNVGGNAHGVHSLTEKRYLSYIRVNYRNASPSLYTQRVQQIGLSHMLTYCTFCSIAYPFKILIQHALKPADSPKRAKFCPPIQDFKSTCVKARWFTQKSRVLSMICWYPQAYDHWVAQIYLPWLLFVENIEERSFGKRSRKWRQIETKNSDGNTAYYTTLIWVHISNFLTFNSILNVSFYEFW